MAVAVYTLVHDVGKKNVSILTQLGIKKSITYIASGPEIDRRNLLASTPLVMMRMSQRGARYVPLLGDEAHSRQTYLSFGDWWTRDLIFLDGANEDPRTEFTRKRLVFALRNKEGGGAHYDPKIDDEAYVTFSQKPLWFSKVGEKKFPVLQLELASMRQIAWELLETLRTNGVGLRRQRENG